jgi:short-subunit dehydrogenase
LPSPLVPKLAQVIITAMEDTASDERLREEAKAGAERLREEAKAGAERLREEAKAGAGPVVVFGGRSEIGVELATRLARGHAVVLAARRCDQLAEQVAAVEAAGATAVQVVEFDADELGSHGPVVDAIIAEHGCIGIAVLAFGILGDQARAEVDPLHAAAIVHTDFAAQVSLLTVLAARMRVQGRGTLVVFSSVAGARVRRANYVYGSAKAGLDGFALGLTDALHGSGVHLLLVRPGFVIGRMTEGMSPAPLSSTPGQVADAAARALRKGRREVWVPPLLGGLVFAFRLLPRAVWRRMPR